MLLFGLIALAAAEYQLTLLNNYPMAVCLDGTPGGYYFEPSTTGSLNVQFYFEGGGWCYEADDCWERSNTFLGSSTTWPQTEASLGGLMSPNCTSNPQFCDWNRVWLVYCDGNSFTGMRIEPIVVRDKPLFWRGRYIIDAIMADLAVNPATANVWNNAEQFMVTGCSAGGLAAYLHGDYVLSNIPSKPSVTGIVPISGFFLNSPNLNLIPVYPAEIQGAFYLANNTLGLPAACIEQYIDAPYLCNFAPLVYPTIKNRVFILNSMFDIWQVNCILLAVGVPSSSTANGNCGALWADDATCATFNDAQLGTCTALQIDALNGYGDIFMASLGKVSSQDGAFICSCLSHCEGQIDPFYSEFAIDGITISSAVSSWWTGSSSNNVHIDCTQLTFAEPQLCNPQCATLTSEDNLEFIPK